MAGGDATGGRMRYRSARDGLAAGSCTRRSESRRSSCSRRVGWSAMERPRRAAPATYSEPAARTASSPSAYAHGASAHASLDGVERRGPRRSRGARAAAATSLAGHAARRRRGAREHDVELVGAQRGEHLRRVAQRADDEDPPALGVEVVEEHLRARVGAGRVVGAVDDHERLVRRSPRTGPGIDDVGEPLRRPRRARAGRRRTPRPR